MLLQCVKQNTCKDLITMNSKQTIATLNATYRNIVECNMLRAFGHTVATCCDMLGVVGSNLKMVKFFMQQLWMLYGVVVAWTGSCNNSAPGHAH